MRRLLIASAAGLWVGGSGGVEAQSSRSYDEPLGLAVANESSDILSIVSFDGVRLTLEREIDVGMMPADLDGAHGVAAAPDGTILLSLAHGTPLGKLWRYDRSGALLDSLTLGRFPATIAVSEGGVFALVSNFDLHGDPVPSWVSVVLLSEMEEVARIETCIRPHGGRIAPAAGLHYSVCAGDDQLVEISLEAMAVTRRLTLPGCGPTWASPHPDGASVFVACNAGDEIVRVSTASWAVERRIDAPGGPYNTVLTPRGDRLLVTNKAGRSVSVFDPVSGAEMARIETSEALPHGVVVSQDGRFAFVTNEAIGARPGTLDAIDLERLERVAFLELRLQPGGIALLTDGG